jgi:hypothetical protein
MSNLRETFELEYAVALTFILTNPNAVYREMKNTTNNQ